MQNTKSHIILVSTFLLLVAAPASFADLMCYVCDDCTNVNTATPLLACNEDYFNQGGSTEASTVTTTTSTPQTSTEQIETTTTTAEISTASSTDPATVETTTEVPVTTDSTENTETTQSTEAPIPTPATVGPPETTTGLPTPPNTDFNSDVTRLSPVDSAVPVFPVRQRRASVNTGVSYHCYSVQKTVNNTAQTERGCSRVTTEESVCKNLELQNAASKLSNCDPCSMNACNSATSVLQSTMLGTFLVVLVAVVLQKN